MSTIFTADKLMIDGINPEAIKALGQDSVTMTAWQALIPVYKMPADTSLKNYQPVQPGKYSVDKNNEVTFIPDTPFKTGQTYFARLYHFAQGTTLWDHVKERRKMSAQPYTDLILKR